MTSLHRFNERNLPPLRACRTSGPTDDGEGWDGECGSCADKREAEFDGAFGPAASE